MSRYGKQPIVIPEKTDVTIGADGMISVVGPLGTLSRPFRKEVSIKKEENQLVLAPAKETGFALALWGTYAAHLRNMIHGVNEVFQKKLVVEGVGFRVELSGSTLTLFLGFSHPVVVQVPEGITVTVERNTITIAGIDTEAVGAFAAKVRAIKKPEPYKGKGIRYDNEVVRRKQGKKTA